MRGRNICGRLGLERLVAGFRHGGPTASASGGSSSASASSSGFGLGHDRLDVRRLGLALRELLVRRDAAVA